MTAYDRSGTGRSAYLEQEILNEDPVARVARIYEMACLNIRRACSAIENDDMRTKANAVKRASQCVALLQASLDLDKGGEIAANLDRLYTYHQLRLSEAHLHNDCAAFDEVREQLGELGGAWREAARRRGASAPAATRAPEAGERPAPR